MRGFGVQRTEAYCHNLDCEAFNHAVVVTEVTEYGLTTTEPSECAKCISSLEAEPIPVDTILDEIAEVLDQISVDVPHLHKATNEAQVEALAVIVRTLRTLGGEA